MSDSDSHSTKFQAAINQFRDRARKALEDKPLVEDLLERASARAKRSDALRESLDPLRRLVRSYIRGSYREADLGDVAWALAGVMYVASPMDLVPDYLPGGLRDDERVVEWVLDRIEVTVAAYEAWEQSIGEREVLANGDVESEAPGDRTLSLDVQVVDAVDSALFHRTDAPAERSIAPMAANPIVAGVAELNSALRSGQVVQVIGPAPLLEGLADKSLELIHSGGGHLGTLRDAGTKDFAGHLRFGDTQAQNAAAPALAAFQVASAVTLQYYLARIDRQLGEIHHEVRGIRQDTRDARYGKIETARGKCTSIENVIAATGTLGTNDVRRFDLAANDLEQTYNALRASVEAFCANVEAVHLPTVDKDNLETLLNEGANTALTDTQLLLFACVIRHRIHGLQVFVHRDDGERRVNIALDELDEQHRVMIELLGRVQRAFRKLHIPKRELDERWGVLGGPETALRQFSSATQALRTHLADTRTALPPFAPQEPFLMELRLAGDNQVEVEWAYLREQGRDAASLSADAAERTDPRPQP